ncbi:hypothetical protein CerSpe_292810 [Prunus speciosa]
MAPPKKSKKSKKDRKLKKNLRLVPVEPKAADSDWWDSFFNPREDLVSRLPSGLINIEGRLLSVEKWVAITFRRLASALEERAKHHLKWPDSNRMEEIKSKLEEAFGLPNCCGAIDGTHIIMTLPTVQTSDDWCDLEDNYSIL